MPETLTQKMARFKLATAAGDLDAARRIAAEARHQARPAIPCPTGYSLTPTGATFPELAKLDQTTYAAICADATRLASEVRQWKSAAQTSGRRAADFERQLNQALAKIEALEQTIENA